MKWIFLIVLSAYGGTREVAPPGAQGVSRQTGGASNFKREIGCGRAIYQSKLVMFTHEALPVPKSSNALMSFDREDKYRSFYLITESSAKLIRITPATVATRDAYETHRFSTKMPELGINFELSYERTLPEYGPKFEIAPASGTTWRKYQLVPLEAVDDGKFQVDMFNRFKRALETIPGNIAKSSYFPKEMGQQNPKSDDAIKAELENLICTCNQIVGMDQVFRDLFKNQNMKKFQKSVSCGNNFSFNARTFDQTNSRVY